MKHLMPILFALGICLIPFRIGSVPTGSDQSLVSFSLFPRQVLECEGSDLESVIWDYETSPKTVWKKQDRETVVFPYFQIPADAQQGQHTLCFMRSNGECLKYSVSIEPLSGSWPDPRIEDIGMRGIENNKNKEARVHLAVPVANADLKCRIYVDNVECTNTRFVAALLNPYFASHSASTYGYPVYHYVMFEALVEKCRLGKNLQIRVVNDDNLSAERSYYIPATSDSLDSDNDGLLDSWEKNGYETSDGSVDLPKMGCNPYRKDVLVEVDWIKDAEPDESIWAPVMRAFDKAPVLNPDGTQGIAIHIDHGQGRPFDKGGTILDTHSTMDFAGKGTDEGLYNYYSYKSNKNNFDPARKDVFHYCVFGRARPDGRSGCAEIWGNDFMVTFATWENWGDVTAETGTFLHELGHNIGLHHGGIHNGAADMDCTNKPNQPSTMNYRYQMEGVSVDCDFRPDGIHTFSKGMLAHIDLGPPFEKTKGICDNQFLDIDNTPGTNQATIVVLDPESCSNVSSYFDYDEWGNLKLNFRDPNSGWEKN